MAGEAALCTVPLRRKISNMLGFVAVYLDESSFSISFCINLFFLSFMVFNNFILHVCVHTHVYIYIYIMLFCEMWLNIDTCIVLDC